MSSDWNHALDNVSETYCDPPESVDPMVGGDVSPTVESKPVEDAGVELEDAGGDMELQLRWCLRLPEGEGEPGVSQTTSSDMELELESSSEFMSLEDAQAWLAQWHAGAQRVRTQRDKSEDRPVGAKRDRTQRDRSGDHPVGAKRERDMSGDHPAGEQQVKQAELVAPCQAVGEESVKGDITDNNRRHEEDTASAGVAKETPKDTAGDAELSTMSIWERLTGWATWRKERQVKRSAAEAVATYQGVDTWGEDDIVVDPKVPFAEWVRQGVDKRLGKYVAVRKHNSVHREKYRFDRNAKLIKILAEEVYVSLQGKLQKGDANDCAVLHLAIKQVVEGAFKDGVQCPVGPDGVMQQVKVRREQRKFFIDAVKAFFFVANEADDFWSAIATGGSAVTK